MPSPDTAPALTPACATILALLNPDTGATSGQLPALSNLGKSTVQKALVTLESARLARRVAGSFHEGARIPDQWYAAAEPAPAPPSPHVPIAQDAPADHEHPQVPDPQEPNAADFPQPTEQNTPDGDDANTAPAAYRPAPQDPADQENEPDTGAQSPGPELSADAAESPDAPRSPEAITAPPESPAVTAPGAPRLAKGALRQMVADYLQADPGLEITPGRMAKYLGRSTGAVSNALDTLAEKGQVEMTKESPRTFRWTATGAR